MAVFLGIDTSNYTTSTAVYVSHTGEVRQNKRLLPVAGGAVGLRQSDAVFGHVKVLGELAGELLADIAGPVTAVGVSVSPRDETGSYMPCFLAGEMAARTAAATAGVPLYTCSHQGGHIAAALFGAGQLDLLDEPLLAFHISGGTTQCLHVTPGEDGLPNIHTIAQSIDLHAGQAVDRVGAMLGLAFPAGPALEKLAEESVQNYRPKVTFKGVDCCLSGVENQCRRLLAEEASPCDVAKYCMCFLRDALLAMTGKVLVLHPGLPVIYAGGVMSNQFLQRALAMPGRQVFFAPPAYSADNAAGVALLCARLHGRKGESA